MNELMTRLLEEQREALDRAQSFIGTILLDAYEVEEVLGAGTYGITLKAQDTMVDQPVAIKWIYRSYRDTVKREFKMVAELSRLPCVPRYLASREEEGEFYLVMEYIGGGDLGRLIAKGGIPILQGLELSLKLFRALSLVHSKRVGGRRLIHRDIKPANLLLDEDGELYITDFGAARIVSTRQESQLSGTGTSGYMAPEIATGRYDQRVDIYSAGMVMYELFGGKEPADPESLFHKEPFLSGGQKEVLRGIVDKAIAKQEDDRYGSAEEVVRDLEDVERELSGAVEQKGLGDLTLGTEVLVRDEGQDVTLGRDVLAGVSEPSEPKGEKEEEIPDTEPRGLQESAAGEHAVYSDEELWKRVQTLSGNTIHTIGQRRPNRILRVTDEKVLIEGRKSAPSREDLLWVYHYLNEVEEITRENLPDRLSQTRVGRIILAILAEVSEDVEAFETGGGRTGRLSGIRRKSSLPSRAVRTVASPTASDFQAQLDQAFQAAQRKGLSYVDVKSGDLHRQVGGYPGANHRMPVCCNVMRQNMRTGDSVLHEPPKGKGASLEIRYKIPRPARPN